MKQLPSCQAIAHGPKLVLLDDPPTVLTGSRIRMLQLVREIRIPASQRADLFPLLRDIEECCDQVLILKDADRRVVQSGRRTQANLKFLELEVTQGNGFLESVRGLGANALALAPDASALCCQTISICARSIAPPRT